MRTAIPPIVLTFLLFAIILIIIYAIMPDKPGSNLKMIIEWVVVAVGLLAVLAITSKHLIRLRSIKYRLSSQRIFIEHGLLNKRIDEVELEHYKDVFVNEDFWDKMVGCGDIKVITGDVTNEQVDIIDVINPVGKKEMIRTAARERKIALGIMRREEL